MDSILRCTRTAVFLLYFVVSLLSLSQLSKAAEVLRPRGVPLSKKIFYDPGKDFSCLDGSATIPFHFVNDDYCDCSDGSDEPGTAACPNGVFHCTNAGYIESVIPSSRVNDGICDCCDTSDEYNSSAECINNCLDLGQQARETERKKLDLLKQGYEVKLEMIKEGREAREEAKKKLEELQQQKETAQQIRTEKEDKKKEAEEKEKTALEKYKTEEEEKKRQSEEEEMREHQEMERKLAVEAFDEMDEDKNGLLTVSEIQKFPKFDQNRDGVVSEDEAKFFLHMKEEMEKEEFTTTGWMIMKPIYMMDKIRKPKTPSPDTEREIETEDLQEQVETVTTEGKAEVEEVPLTTPTEEEEEEDELEEDLEEEEEDYVEPPQFPPKDDVLSNKVSDTKQEPKYDEETQRIIDEAKVARDEFSEADANLRRIENELRDVELKVSIDYGPDDEFASLHGQCFDLSDREYTYRLCPFDRASQKPSSGGAETNLGKWGKWAGPENSKYEKMKYEGGLTCWNGPARSVLVNLHCGVENRLSAASEPNRCEYMFDFTTPAVCSEPPSQDSMFDHIHMEL